MIITCSTCGKVEEPDVIEFEVLWDPNTGEVKRYCHDCNPYNRPLPVLPPTE